ncbi:7TMR-DISM family protein [Oligoflexus tunisiensis]|uniref:7TMR-DISM family protein n=1 Tax=Oligoflexus tunisiensis TaxID=708132 RepID=UPI00159EFC2B|nr:7TM diverse intracellular signaling domain-containing protein [Oligoflexus tunisiensis]
MLSGFFIIILLLGSWSTHAAASWVYEPGRHEMVANEVFHTLCTRETLDWSTVLSRASELKPTTRHSRGIIGDEECWSVITVENRSAGVERVFLEHGLAITSRIELYQIIGGQLVYHRALGLDIPFREWAVDYRLPIFDFRLNPGVNTLVLRQKSRDVFALDWRLYHPEYFYSRIIPELLLFGGFFAICFALSFYNLVIYFVTREITHVFYFLYLNLYAMAQLYVVGLSKQLILQDIGPALNQLGIITIDLALIFTTLFIYYFLDFHERKDWFRKLIRFFIGMLCVTMVVTLWNEIPLAATLTQSLSFICSCIGVVAAISAVRRRHPLAYYYILAWSMLIVGNAMQVLHLQGLVPDEPWIVSLNFVGASFEAIIISYALAHKMRLGRLRETQRRRHAFSQLAKMVYPHQMDQMKQGEILETTMPHAAGEAVVICLDIIASTSSQIENLSNFLRRFFDRCDHLMSRDYQGETLSASGFRIKEMGDGFLCAVGFPFATPHGRASHDVAMQLAFGFLDAFDQEFSSTVSAERTYCSLGLARGPIQGFFTVSGIRSYELFGHSIVLATRYESLRKQWPAERAGHMITVQSRLYESLDPRYQKLFKKHKLGPGMGAIRNDAEADAFYRGIFASGEAAEVLSEPAEPFVKSLAS